MLSRVPAFILCAIIIIALALDARVRAGPVPELEVGAKVLPEIPQWHCLRYFKHDVLMMRRCRHLYVPTMPRGNYANQVYAQQQLAAMLPVQL